MSRQARARIPEPVRTYAFEAEVVGVGDDEVAVRSMDDASNVATARPAVIGWRASVGDRVVVIDGFVVGVRACRDVVLEAPSGRVVLTGVDVELRATGNVLLRSERIEMVARELSSVLGKVELRAQRVVESVVDVYRDVEGMMQTRAGRVRTLVRGAYRLFAQRTDVRSREDTAIDGKRVLLG